MQKTNLKKDYNGETMNLHFPLSETVTKTPENQISNLKSETINK